MPLFHYAPTVFTSIAKVVKSPLRASKDITQFAETAQKLSTIEFALDEAAQAVALQERLVPAVVGVTEAAPALVTDSAGVVGAVGKTESSVAANASKAIQKSGAAGEAIVAENSATQGALEARKAIKIAEIAETSPALATDSAGAVGNAAKSFQKSKLQHMYSRHAKDFGMQGNWSNLAGLEFEGIILKHMQSARLIEGTYRGTQRVLHYFDPATSLNVMVDAAGNLIGGWKLSADQIKYLLTTGAVK